MATVILICGKIASGKTTYANHLCGARRAFLLSADEVMRCVFPENLGKEYDRYARRVQEYLYRQAARLCGMGISVVLDWGFWRKSERDHAKAFFDRQGIPYEFHYLSVEDGEWKSRIRSRNAAVQAGEADAYLVDEGLMEKFSNAFEPPAREEMDVWVENEY